MNRKLHFLLQWRLADHFKYKLSGGDSISTLRQMDGATTATHYLPRGDVTRRERGRKSERGAELLHEVGV